MQNTTSYNLARNFKPRWLLLIAAYSIGQPIERLCGSSSPDTHRNACVQVAKIFTEIPRKQAKNKVKHNQDIMQNPEAFYESLDTYTKRKLPLGFEIENENKRPKRTNMRIDLVNGLKIKSYPLTQEQRWVVLAFQALRHPEHIELLDGSIEQDTAAKASKQFALLFTYKFDNKQKAGRKLDQDKALVEHHAQFAEFLSTYTNQRLALLWKHRSSLFPTDTQLLVERYSLHKGQRYLILLYQALRHPEQARVPLEPAGQEQEAESLSEEEDSTHSAGSAVQKGQRMAGQPSQTIEQEAKTEPLPTHAQQATQPLITTTLSNETQEAARQKSATPAATNGLPKQEEEPNNKEQTKPATANTNILPVTSEHGGKDAIGAIQKVASSASAAAAQPVTGTASNTEQPTVEKAKTTTPLTTPGTSDADKQGRAIQPLEEPTLAAALAHLAQGTASDSSQKKPAAGAAPNLLTPTQDAPEAQKQQDTTQDQSTGQRKPGSKAAKAKLPAEKPKETAERRMKNSTSPETEQDKATHLTSASASEDKAGTSAAVSKDATIDTSQNTKLAGKDLVDDGGTTKQATDTAPNLLTPTQDATETQKQQDTTQANKTLKLKARSRTPKTKLPAEKPKETADRRMQKSTSSDTKQDKATHPTPRNQPKSLWTSRVGMAIMGLAVMATLAGLVYKIVAKKGRTARKVKYPT